MKKVLCLFRANIFIFVCFFLSIAVNAQTTTFTYQGRLTEGSAAANGTYQMQFALFDASTNGTQIGATQTNTNVTVANGVFTVQLDFGANPFTSGADRFLEIAVKKPADAAYTTLSPRQQLTSSPYSIRTLSSSVADSLSSACLACVTNAQINSVDGSKVTGTVANAANATTANTANTANSANTATTAGNVTGVVAISNGGTGSSTKNFVDLTTAQTVAGAKTFSDNLRTNGLLRVGSETGTGEAPQINQGTYVGLVVRRINSGVVATGQVVARTNFLRLERDGSDAGWRIGYDALPDQEVQSVHCIGVNNAGGVVTARLMLDRFSTGGSAGTAQLFTAGQNIEYMQCSFGNAFNMRHSTQVTLQRFQNQFIWVGVMTSTFNQ